MVITVAQIAASVNKQMFFVMNQRLQIIAVIKRESHHKCSVWTSFKTKHLRMDQWNENRLKGENLEIE